MPTVDDKFRVALKFALPDAQVAFNNLNLAIISGTVDDATLLVALGVWIAAMYANIDGEIDPGVDIETSQVYQMTYSLGQWVVDRIVGTVTPVFTGTNPTEMLPHQMAAVPVYKTTRSRSYGKTFLPGFGEDTQSAGVMTAGTLVNLALWVADFLATQPAGTATFKTRLFRHDGTLGVYTSSDINDVMGTQRRRKIGVGI